MAGRLMEFSKDFKPIRVVDIAGTIDARGGVLFTEPQDWSFHVISHTWSKSVRDFSSEIGRSHVGTAISYNQAFKEADFSEAVGYRQMLDFFGLLEKDGVKYAWFDALCINQVDDDEKSREISHMGAYYANSEGCYVLTHGLGRGFELWKEEEAVESGDDEAGGIAIVETDAFKKMYESTGKGSLTLLTPEVMAKAKLVPLIKLPRWFRRVWTFQEFMLPKKLIFLVGGLSKRVKMHLNWRISRCAGTVGFCKCCLPPKEFVMSKNTEEFLEAFHGGDASEGCSSSTMSSGDDEVFAEVKICSECGSKPLVKKAADELLLAPWETTDDPAIYFVDREAHLCLARLNNLKLRELSHPLIQLYALLDEYKPVDVVYQVASRRSTNDEDRVLSVLGLLGVQLNQVSTGKTLEEQIVHLITFCKNPAVVLQLCAVDGRGYHSPGMSWAPNFRCNDGRFPHVGMGDHVPGVLCPLAKVVSCEGPYGVLALETKLASGPLTTISEQYLSGSQVHEIFLSDQPAGKELVRLYASVRSNYSAPSIETQVKVATVHDNPSGPTIDKDTLGELHLTYCRQRGSVRFQLWAILLGEGIMFKEVRKLAMACVGLSERSLHKIRVLAFPIHVADRVFPAHAPATLCCVSGLGRYLDDYIFEMNPGKLYV